MNQTLYPSPNQKENTRHGEPLFPVQKYITSLSMSYPRVTAHWHEEVEWTYIREGCGTYQLALSPYSVGPGDFLFIPPAMLHSIFVKDKKTFSSETYVFHLNFLGLQSADICSVQYLTPLQSQTLIPPLVIRKDHPAYQKIYDIFQNVQSVFQNASPGYELILKSQFLLLMATLLPYCEKTAPDTARNQEHTQKLKTVLEYLEKHYDEELSVAQLAELCYFSEYHFMRFFKKHIGLSCLNYLKNLRLEKAAELLLKGNESPLEISLSVGFRNLSYFYREFKKRYGMTPREFRLRSPHSFSHPLPNP